MQRTEIKFTATGFALLLFFFLSFDWKEMLQGVLCDLCLIRLDSICSMKMMEGKTAA